MRALVAIAICLSASSISATPVLVKSQRERATLQFEAFWGARLDEYRRKSAEANAEHKAAADAVLSDPPFSFAADDARLGPLIGAAEASGRIGGKGEELDACLRHMRSRPTPGLTQAYLQGRMENIKEAMDEAQRVRIALGQLLEAKDTTIRKLLTEIEHTAMTRGDVIGRAEVLGLVIGNWGAYASDYAAASAKDRESRARLGAALGAFGRAISANRGWTASCVRTGDFVNCSGRQ